MALRPHGSESNNNARGISELRVLVLHKKSLSTQQAAGRDNHHHPESYATDGFGSSAEEAKRFGLSTRNVAFGGLVDEDRGSLRRRRKGGLAAAARTGGGGGGVDSKGAPTHFASHPGTPRPPVAPATPPPRGPYYEYAYEEDDYSAAGSSPAGGPIATDASGLPDTQPQVARNVSFSEEVKEVLIENRRQTYGNKASRRQHFYSKAELATFKRAWHCHVKSSSRPVNGLMACGCPGCDYDYDEGRAPPTLQKVVPPIDYNRWVWEG
ncbi:unnamed protein product [Ectocarpus sp. CCAP 1310/34]|nr:unnamed protein product [Ectocarpus sp. CCAP 1310/34]